MIYLTSDLHFNHKNIMLYENRPFESVEAMNEGLIKRWNAVVQPEDIVINLGDVALGRFSEVPDLVSRLNGHKILILGNHDTYPVKRYLDMGFAEVVNSKIITYFGKTIFLSHRPETVSHREPKCDLHFYGHVHGTGGLEGKNFPTVARNGACLCVERWDYRPVALGEVIKLCEQSKEICKLIR